MIEGKSATAINCIDGRVQEVIISWFKIRHGYDYVDMITEPGPIKLLSEGDAPTINSIRRNVLISTEKHGSDMVAVVGHHDCAGNPVERDVQVGQIKKSIELVRSWGTKAKIIGMYINDMWSVEVVQE